MKKIKVNILKENPLKVIVKNGFIPVVRFSNDGFKNYNQEDYFKKKELNIKPFEGCFCNLGGIQGRWVSGHHYMEDLYIGYILPNTKVFSTYFFYEENFKVTTAEYRYLKAMNSFNLCHNDYDGVLADGNLEDFDVISEAIVNANDIKFVCKISYDELFNLARYYDDGYLRLLSLEDLYYSKIDDVDFEFFKLLNLKNQDEIYDFFDKSKSFYLRKEFLMAFYKYIAKGKHFVDFNRLISFDNDVFEFNEWTTVLKESYDKSFGLIDVSFYYNEDSLYCNLDLDSYRTKRLESLTMSIHNGVFSFSKIMKVPYSFDFFNSYKHKKDREFVKLTLNDLLDKDLLPYVFCCLTVLNKYIDTFSKYYDISMSDTYYQLLSLKELFDNIEKEGKNVSVSKDDYLLKIDILDGIDLEFNLILKDFVVSFNEEDDDNKFFNINNIPLEYEVIKEYIEDFISNINFKKGEFNELLKN